MYFLYRTGLISILCFFVPSRRCSSITLKVSEIVWAYFTCDRSWVSGLWFKPSSKIFYWPFQGGISFVDLLYFFCLVFAMPLCVSVYIVPCGHLLGKGWPLRSHLWCLTVSLSLSPLVSWVWGTWLYWFLIFTLLLTIRECNENLIFLFLHQNICCGYSKEPSQCDCSFEHPKRMLKLMGKKILTILRKILLI